MTILLRAISLATVLCAISTAAVAEAPVVYRLECRGEEPFWSLEANETSASFKRLGGHGREGQEEKVLRGLPLPGAGNPVYYPAREQPPRVTCGRLERVESPRGVLAGWLHYDPC